MLSAQTASLILAISAAAGGSVYFTVSDFNQQDYNGHYSTTIKLTSTTPISHFGSHPHGVPA
jgi:C1A family cysteine protease